MSTIHTVLLVTICTFMAHGQLTNSVESVHEAVDHYLIRDTCLGVLNEQISWELYASLVYMNMGAYFDRPSVGRLGFGKFFRDQSKEEYEHATKIVDYISKRNGTVKRITVEESPKNDWSSPKEALVDAISLEKHVYAKLQHIRDVADQKCQDAHLIDFLESFYFTEQVESIRELQIMLSTLDVPDPNAANVIEYMEDVKLRSLKTEL